MGSARTQHTDIRPGMDLLTLFGLFAVTAMLVSYTLEDRSPWFILASPARAPWLSLRLPSRCVAVRPGGGYLGRCRRSALARKETRQSAYLSLFPGAAEPLVTTSGFGHLEGQHFAPIARP